MHSPLFQNAGCVILLWYKYPVLEKFENRNIVLLDSAGLETPILKTENETCNPTEDGVKEKDYFK